MTDIPDHGLFDDEAVAASAGRWAKLLSLADMIEIDAASGSLVIRNGKSRLVLRSDGVVIAEGTRILHSAERDIAMQAAVIDLN